MGTYTYKTTVTQHKECMERLAAKCHWEHMSRLAVLAEYEDIICKDCRNKMGIQEIQSFFKRPKERTRL